MSNYSDDDYLRLLAKYNDANKRLEAAERQLAAAREAGRAMREAQREYRLGPIDDGKRWSAMLVAEAAFDKAFAAALANTDPAPAPVGASYRFDRYVAGKLMAEGISVRADSLNNAIFRAVKLCPEAHTVLVSAPAERPER